MASAVALAACSAALIPLSSHFVYGHGHAARPILTVVAILLAGGLAYAVAVGELARTAPSPTRVAGVIAFSLFLSGMQLLARPIQAADYYRYLLDGAVTACGGNPYALSPAEQERAVDTVQAMSGKRRTRAASTPVCLGRDPGWQTMIERVEYRRLQTIYPPLMQYWFAATVRLGGTTLRSLRLSFLLVELLLLVGLAFLLARTGGNPLLVAVYGWAPIVFKELFNSAHYDGVPALFLITAFLLLAAQRPLWATLALGGAAASKLFALALVPLWMRTIDPRKRPLALGLLAAVVAIPYLPFAGAGSALFTGLWAFAHRWSLGAPVFTPLVHLAGAAGLRPAAARLTVTTAVALAVVAVSLLYPIGRGKTVVRSALAASRVILALLLLAGPLPNPWYFCWLLPFVAFDPRPMWLALIVMLPLYYVDFHLIYHGLTAYRPYLVTAEFLPFSILALRELLYRNRSSAGGRTRAAARPRPQR